MAPHRGKGRKPFSFMPKTPHFFKIILQSTLDDQKLMIPVKFVKNHGEHLQKQAVLKVQVPRGETWEIELKKSNGKVWLEKGWKEFADYYSLAHGNFLVFEYRRQSPHLYVLIFDNTATEIDYCSKRNDPEQPPPEEKDSEDDKSVVILDDSSFLKKKRGRSPLPSPRPRKIIKADSTTKTSGKRVLRDRPMTDSTTKTSGKRVLRDSLMTDSTTKTSGKRVLRDRPMTDSTTKTSRKRVLRDRPMTDSTTKTSGKRVLRDSLMTDSTTKTSGKRVLRDKSQIFLNTQMGTGQRRSTRRARIVGTMPLLTKSEKSIALERVSSFDSKNPFCKVVMQSNSISKQFILVIPVGFARKYFPGKEGKVTFNGPQGRTWPATYCFSEQARILDGWKNFAQENCLQIGDVCVFELIDSKKILLNVVIFRVGEENLKNHQFQDESQRLRNSYTPRRAKPLTAIDKADAFKSKSPFFSVIMQRSYVHSKCGLNIPYKFAKKYLKDNGNEVILRVSNGRTWAVEYGFYVSKCCFYSSWTAFMKDNNLEVGDVCVFELMKGNEISLQVYIFRCNEEAKVEYGESLSISRCNEEAKVECGESSVVYGDVPYPFFYVVMQKSAGESYVLHVPRSFTEKYVKQEKQEMLLQVGDSSWTVVLNYYPRSGNGRLSTGWAAFAKGNSLERGDVCTFELIKSNVLRVSISPKNLTK